jgi:hypothetical protein
MLDRRLVTASLVFVLVAGACDGEGFDAGRASDPGTVPTTTQAPAGSTTEASPQSSTEAPPPTTTSPDTTVTTAASTTTTTSTATTTTSTATTTTAAPVPVPAGEQIGDRVSTAWQGDDLVLRHADGSDGSFVGPLFCLSRVAGRCIWHLTFASASPSDSVVEGFAGRALLLRLVEGTQIHAIVAALPLDVAPRTGIPVLVGALDDAWHVITLAYGPTGPSASAAWSVGLDPPGFSSTDPSGFAAPQGTGRLVFGNEVDVTTDALATIPLWSYSGAIVGDLDVLQHAVSVLRESEDGPPAVVWLERKLGSIPDGSPLWWVLDTVRLPEGTTAVSMPGECTAGGGTVVVSLVRESCDVCLPAADGWVVDVAAETLTPVAAASISCRCICEG